MKRRQFLRFGLGSLLAPAAFAADAKKAPALPRLLDPRGQRQFVNPLPIPRVAAPVSSESSHYEIAIGQFRQHLGLPDPKTGAPLLTTLWGYDGRYPRPTLAARSGAPNTVLNFYFLIAPAARGFVANTPERDEELVEHFMDILTRGIVTR